MSRWFVAAISAVALVVSRGAAADRLRAFFVACTLATASYGAGCASAETFRWTQYGPEGAEARAIVEGFACPAATIDGVPVAMSARSEPGAGYFVQVCAARLPPNVRTLEIAGVPVAVPIAEPRRIAIVGDTGCRLDRTRAQACNDPHEWPFRLIAEAIAYLRPDAVIHVGDYHYRDVACPAGNRGCAGSPFGDTWAVWRADFFAPAETLLRTAPWLFVRGNREVCGRGGSGWSRALDPYPFDARRGCNDIGAPFVAQLGALQVGVLDASSADETRVDPRQVETYQAAFARLADLMPGGGWLALHHPIWTAVALRDGASLGHNPSLAAAAHGRIAPGVELIVAGHRRLFQVYNYPDGVPPQLVAGHGGDLLETGVLAGLAGLTISGIRIQSSLTMTSQFGFVLAERDGAQWVFTNYDALARARATCRLAERAMACTVAR